MGDMRHFSLT